MTKDRFQSISKKPSHNISLFKTVLNINNSFSNSPIISIIFLSTYIFFLLILPLSALLFILFTNNWDQILERALDPIAVSAYILTLKMAFFAALINTIFGFIITWVL